MTLPTLYPPQVGSPYTTLTAPFTVGDATMQVADPTILPAAPNLICMAGADAGEFTYTGKTASTLTGIVHKGGPVGITWPTGTYVYRGISAYDHASIVEHLTYQRSHIVEASLDLTTNLSYSGRILEGAEAGENLAFGDLAVLAESGKFVKANPAALATLDGTIALVVSDTIAAGSQGMFLLRGLIRNDSWTFSQGKELYASNGTLTHEPPTTGTQIIRKVGTALTATIIEFNPSSTLHAEYLVSVLPVNTVSKDNGDVERKFWKDDFSVDSSSQYIGDAGRFTWDTANSQLIPTAAGKIVRPDLFGSNYYTVSITPSALPSSGAHAGIVLYNPSTGQHQYFGIYISGTSYYARANGTILTSSGGAVAHTLGVPIQIEFNASNPASAQLRIICTGGISEPPSLDLASAGFTSGKWYVGVYTSSFTWENSTFKAFTCRPSISYSDDFATDTTERYRSPDNASSSVAYDSVNKKVNVTLTGVPGGARRVDLLKSYRFGEGSFRADISIPATVYGFSSFGVGLFSPTSCIWMGLTYYNSEWSFKSYEGVLPDAYVNIGAQSIPFDVTPGEKYTIEMEYDKTHGVIYGYCWIASGVKPVTPTMKLYTSNPNNCDMFGIGMYHFLSAYTIIPSYSNISIRAESIVGRTNVEVTEPFWFRDEFGEDSLGRYLGTKTELTVSGGKLVPSMTSQNLKLPSTLKYVESKFDFRIDTAFYLTETSRASLIFGVQTDFTGVAITYGYVVTVAATVSSTVIGLYKDSYITLETSTLGYALTVDTDYEIKVVHSAGNIKVYLDDVLVIDFDDDTYTSGYAGLMIHSSSNNSAANIRIDNLQITGTRVYNKPIHRGAMLETYHDGTQEVVGTTFIDDCQWDRSTEYTITGATWDTVNGCIVLNGLWENIISSQIYSYGYFKSRMSFSSTGQTETSYRSIYFTSGSPVQNDIRVIFGLHSDNELYLSVDSYIDNAWICKKYLNLGSYTHNTLFDFEVLMTESNVSCWKDGVLLSSIVVTNNGIKSPNFAHEGVGGASALDWKIYNIQIIAASSDASNGIAACIPPIGGGARYGVEESVYIPITPGTEIPVGTAVISPNAKSTVVGTALTTFAQTPAGVSASLEYATGTKACPGLSTAFAPAGRHRVKADRNTLTNIGVKGSVAGTSPAVYIDSLHVRKQEVVS